MLIESLIVATLGAPVPGDLKCPATHRLPGLPEGSAVMLIDGEIRGTDFDFDVAELAPEEIESLAIRCWNPETDELPASGGIPLVIITTKTALAVAESEVRNAALSVQQFSDEHGELPRSLSDLEFDGERLQLARLDSGWEVITIGTRALACSASPEDEGVIDVECRNSYQLAKRNLREAYEHLAPQTS